jgi:hypothetical protein
LAKKPSTACKHSVPPPGVTGRQPILSMTSSAAEPADFLVQRALAFGLEIGTLCLRLPHPGGRLSAYREQQHAPEPLRHPLPTNAQ